MIYTFNLMVGVEPNGVDVSQAHRGRIFRKLGQEACFVMTQLPPREKLDYYLSLGHKEEEILLAHLVLTDQRDIRLGLTVEALKEQLALKATPQTIKNEEHFEEATGMHLVLVRNERQPEFVHQVDYYIAGNLIKREHYGRCKLYTEFFTAVTYPIGRVARVCRRLFHNQDGSVAYEELLETTDDSPSSSFQMGEERFYGQVDLMKRVVQGLDLKKGDLVLLDRFIELPFTQVLLQGKGEAKIAGVIHSEHLYGDRINPEYFYLFQHRKAFDAIIVGTEQQKQAILERFNLVDKLHVLAAGALDYLWRNDHRRASSVVAVGRFDRRKRLDLTIAAVVACHQRNPQITLDIYGKGGLHQELLEQIEVLGASDYIHLKGHQNLEQVYAEYEVFLATSEWETFGLSLMEAVGSGLAMVGLDVPYGNQTFIQEGENGYRVPYYLGDDQQTIEELSMALTKAFDQLSALRQGSYALAESYLEDRLVAQWSHFLASLLIQNEWM